MEKIISLDIAALIVLIALIYSTISRHMTKGTVNRVFMLLLVSTLLANVFDIFAVMLDNAGSQNLPLLYIAHTGYLVFHNITPISYPMFVISVTDIWHKLAQRIWLSVIITIPFIVVIILLLTNPLTNLMFNFDNGSYTRGPWFILLYFSTILYTGLGIVYVLKYRSCLLDGKTIALLSVFPLMFAAMVFQYIFPRYLIEMFANAISLLLVTMTIQRPEEKIDPTTGLSRINSYVDSMRLAFQNDKHVTVISVNISNFSNIRKMLGYEATNTLLRRTGDVLSAANRRVKALADIYYRDLGKFSVVVNVFNKNKAKALAEEINRDLNKDFTINGLDVNLIAYVCAARCPEEIQDFRSLMAFENDFHKFIPFTGEVLYGAEIYKQQRYTLMTEMDEIIDRALANHNFQVYYQPIYSVKEKRFVSAEALLRLIDDKYGFISPEIFIPAAEKSGAIHKIGDFVFEEVCKFIGSEEYRTLNLDYIEVNLSVAQCMQKNLADKVLEVMKRNNVSADQINLEITETAAGYSQNVMSDNLDKLSAAGISFSLDDYGTGYSNMKRVISLPLKIVKLDKSFVDEQNNPKMWIVLQNTVKMLKDMKMEIVVEGIETLPMVEQFSNLECDFIQGYYFSKPIPKDKFVEFIRESLVGEEQQYNAP